MPSTTSRTIQIGNLSLTVSQLTLGQLKSVRAEIQTLMSMRTTAEQMPTVEQLSAMAAVLHISAAKNDASITREMIDQALDELPYDTGMTTLAEAVQAVMQSSGMNGRAGSVTGEAASPAS